MILKDETNCIIYKDIEGWDEFPSFIKNIEGWTKHHYLQRYWRMRQNSIIYENIEGWDKIPLFINDFEGWHKIP